MSDVLDAAALRRWCRLAADALGRTRADIDALNVFPVPDADTGTNMHLTAVAVAEAVEGLPAEADVATVWRALAQGALFGARGNSGVILSQVLRGLGEVPTDDGPGLAEALRRASSLAHGAVEHPVEGTMLSVLEMAGEACADAGDLAATAKAAADGARAALHLTTGQLDVLARNGVVDAGAAGLCVVLDTLAAAITGDVPETYDVPSRGAAAPSHGHQDPGECGYEVMYLLDADDDAVATLRRTLDGLGDSLVVVGDEDEGAWNVHVHVDDAGAAIEAGLRVGRPYRIRVTCLHLADADHRADHHGDHDDGR